LASCRLYNPVEDGHDAWMRRPGNAAAAWSAVRSLSAAPPADFRRTSARGGLVPAGFPGRALRPDGPDGRRPPCLAPDGPDGTNRNVRWCRPEERHRPRLRPSRPKGIPGHSDQCGSHLSVPKCTTFFLGPRPPSGNVAAPAPLCPSPKSRRAMYLPCTRATQRSAGTPQRVVRHLPAPPGADETGGVIARASLSASTSDRWAAPYRARCERQPDQWCQQCSPKPFVGNRAFPGHDGPCSTGARGRGAKHQRAPIGARRPTPRSTRPRPLRRGRLRCVRGAGAAARPGVESERFPVIRPVLKRRGHPDESRRTGARGRPATRSAPAPDLTHARKVHCPRLPAPTRFRFTLPSRAPATTWAPGTSGLETRHRGIDKINTADNVARTSLAPARKDVGTLSVPPISTDSGNLGHENGAPSFQLLHNREVVAGDPCSWAPDRRSPGPRLRRRPFFYPKQLTTARLFVFHDYARQLPSGSPPRGRPAVSRTSGRSRCSPRGLGSVRPPWSCQTAPNGNPRVRPPRPTFSAEIHERNPPANSRRRDRRSPTNGGRQLSRSAPSALGTPSAAGRNSGTGTNNEHLGLETGRRREPFLGRLQSESVRPASVNHRTSFRDQPPASRRERGETVPFLPPTRRYTKGRACPRPWSVGRPSAASPARPSRSPRTSRHRTYLGWRGLDQPAGATGTSPCPQAPLHGPGHRARTRGFSAPPPPRLYFSSPRL